MTDSLLELPPINSPIVPEDLLTVNPTQRKNLLMMLSTSTEATEKVVKDFEMKLETYKLPPPPKPSTTKFGSNGVADAPEDKGISTEMALASFEKVIVRNLIVLESGIKQINSLHDQYSAVTLQVNKLINTDLEAIDEMSLLITSFSEKMASFSQMLLDVMDTIESVFNTTFDIYMTIFDKLNESMVELASNYFVTNIMIKNKYVYRADEIGFDIKKNSELTSREYRKLISDMRNTKSSILDFGIAFISNSRDSWHMLLTNDKGEISAKHFFGAIASTFAVTSGAGYYINKKLRRGINADL